MEQSRRDHILVKYLQRRANDQQAVAQTEIAFSGR